AASAPVFEAIPLEPGAPRLQPLALAYPVAVAHALVDALDLFLGPRAAGQVLALGGGRLVVVTSGRADEQQQRYDQNRSATPRNPARNRTSGSARRELARGVSFRWPEARRTPVGP